jgi:hypothetical protein
MMTLGIGRTTERQITIAVALLLVIGGWRDVSEVDRVKDTKIAVYAVRAPQAIRFAGKTIAADFILGCVHETYDGRPLQLGGYVQFTERVAFLAKGEFRFDQGPVEEFRSAGGDNTGYRINVSLRYEPDQFGRLVSSSSRFRVQTELATGFSFFEFDIRKAGDVIAKLPCNPSR